MSTTKMKTRKWLGVATAAVLMAGSATLTVAASRSNLRTEPSRAPVVSFQWRVYSPPHIVRLDPSNGTTGSMGDLHTDALHLPSVGFQWQTFAPRHMVHNDLPGGSASPSGDTQTDALSMPAATFHWQTFAPPHILTSQPANGASTTTSGGLQTDAMRSTPLRPTLFTGLGLDDAGGIRAVMGMSFRIR